MSEEGEFAGALPAGHTFATTHWSQVLAAGDSSSPQAAEALENLCRCYWYPLYAYLRRCGCGHESAQDLTQEFFARLLEKNYLARADPKKGRFRSFMLAGIRNLFLDQLDKAGRLKRGGGVPVISLDAQTAQDRYGQEPRDEMTPERVFDHAWIVTLLEEAARRLREEYVAAGKQTLYDQLIEFRLDESASRSYSGLAVDLGMTESAVKSAIWRMRRRHELLVREEIAKTVANPMDLEEEIRYLLRVLEAS
jgi:RNA polymerase sigma-70 factor (ECF subfamily)